MAFPEPWKHIFLFLATETSKQPKKAKSTPQIDAVTPQSHSNEEIALVTYLPGEMPDHTSAGKGSEM